MTHVKNKKSLRKSEAFSTQSRGRTGTALQPLVFETNASTDSAIWALLFSEPGCKCIQTFPDPQQIFLAVVQIQYVV